MKKRVICLITFLTSVNLVSAQTWEQDTTNKPKMDIVQYTDFLGFGNDKPNGLLQQQFLFKWPVIQKHWSLFGGEIKIQPLRSILLPSILFNRIDKAKDNNSFLFPVGYTIKNIDTAGAKKDTSLSPVMSTFDIMRYASLKIETRVVLLALTVHNVRIYFDWQGALIRNKITDTIVSKSTIDKSVYSFATGLSVYAKSPLNPIDSALNIEIEAGFNKIFLKDNYFNQYDAYNLDLEGKKAIAFPVGEKFNRTSSPIYYGSIKLAKNWGKDSKNSIYFRMVYNFQTGSYKYYTKERPNTITVDKFYNHYLQFHLGVSLGLENLFK